MSGTYEELFDKMLSILFSRLLPFVKRQIFEGRFETLQGVLDFFQLMMDSLKNIEFTNNEIRLLQISYIINVTRGFIDSKIDYVYLLRYFKLLPTIIKFPDEFREPIA
jgi:hypothetical protein